MPTFKRKSIYVEAVQWTGPDMQPRPPGVYEHGTVGYYGHHFYVISLNGRVRLSPSDWILSEPGGVGFYRFDDELFREHYEPFPNVRCKKCGKHSHENRQKYCGDGSDKDNDHIWEKVPTSEVEIG